MASVARAWSRALRSQFSGRILMLSLLPLLLSVALWGGLMYLFMQPLLDWLHALFTEYGGFAASGSILAFLGLAALKTMVVPMAAMLVLLPLMIVTSLLFMGVVAMPSVVRHVGRRQYPTLERKEGGSMLGSLAVNLGAILVFIVAWLLLLPLYAFPPLALLVHALLWGWLTAKVMSYDALAAHASVEERRQLQRGRRGSLLAIGTLSGLAGALPGIAWVGGALISVVLFPVLAVLSIWLYIVIFIFTGLWFQYYCLEALAEMRAAPQA
ncbi:MAG: EI24 domain-containing protein [Telluria sp.]